MYFSGSYLNNILTKYNYLDVLKMLLHFLPLFKQVYDLDGYVIHFTWLKMYTF